MALGDRPAAGRHTVFVDTRDGRFAIGTLEKGRTEQFQVAYWLLLWLSLRRSPHLRRVLWSINYAYFSYARIFVEQVEFPCYIVGHVVEPIGNVLLALQHAG